MRVGDRGIDFDARDKEAPRQGRCVFERQVNPATIFAVWRCEIDERVKPQTVEGAPLREDRYLAHFNFSRFTMQLLRMQTSPSIWCPAIEATRTISFAFSRRMKPTDLHTS